MTPLSCPAASPGVRGSTGELCTAEDGHSLPLSTGFFTIHPKPLLPPAFGAGCVPAWPLMAPGLCSPPPGCAKLDPSVNVFFTPQPRPESLYLINMHSRTPFRFLVVFSAVFTQFCCNRQRFFMKRLKSQTITFQFPNYIQAANPGNAKKAVTSQSCVVACLSAAARGEVFHVCNCKTETVFVRRAAVKDQRLPALMVCSVGC